MLTTLYIEGQDELDAIACDEDLQKRLRLENFATDESQYYTDLELMAWVDREARGAKSKIRSIKPGKLTTADIATAKMFIRTRELMQRVTAYHHQLSRDKEEEQTTFCVVCGIDYPSEEPCELH